VSKLPFPKGNSLSDLLGEKFHTREVNKEDYLYKLCAFSGNAERAKFQINNTDNSNNFLTYCTCGKRVKSSISKSRRQKCIHLFSFHSMLYSNFMTIFYFVHFTVKFLC